jgi:hypothetical protein
VHKISEIIDIVHKISDVLIVWRIFKCYVLIVVVTGKCQGNVISS